MERSGQCNFKEFFKVFCLVVCNLFSPRQKFWTELLYKKKHSSTLSNQENKVICPHSQSICPVSSPCSKHPKAMWPAGLNCSLQKLPNLNSETANERHHTNLCTVLSSGSISWAGELNYWMLILPCYNSSRMLIKTWAKAREFWIAWQSGLMLTSIYLFIYLFVYLFIYKFI